MSLSGHRFPLGQEARPEELVPHQIGGELLKRVVGHSLDARDIKPDSQSGLSLTGLRQKVDHSAMVRHAQAGPDKIQCEFRRLLRRGTHCRGEHGTDGVPGKDKFQPGEAFLQTDRACSLRRVRSRARAAGPAMANAEPVAANFSLPPDVLKLTRQLEQDKLDSLSRRHEILRKENEQLKARLEKGEKDTHEFVAYFQTELEAKDDRIARLNEELAQQPGQFVSGEQVDKLAVVATSGLMAEASAYGKAVGASEDLALLNQILLRCNPPIPAQKQQDKTRYAALMAWTIANKHPAALEAITTNDPLASAGVGADRIQGLGSDIPSGFGSEGGGRRTLRARDPPVRLLDAGDAEVHRPAQETKLASGAPSAA